MFCKQKADGLGNSENFVWICRRNKTHSSILPAGEPDEQRSRSDDAASQLRVGHYDWACIVWIRRNLLSAGLRASAKGPALGKGWTKFYMKVNKLGSENKARKDLEVMGVAGEGCAGFRDRVVKRQGGIMRDQENKGANQANVKKSIIGC